MTRAVFAWLAGRMGAEEMGMRGFLKSGAFLLAITAGVILMGGEKIQRQWQYVPHLLYPEEAQFMSNLRVLTTEGINAEAYVSPDGRSVIFQSTRGEISADQIFIMDIDGRNPRLVSPGMGRTTCAYFFSDMKHILYASTHIYDSDPPVPAKHPAGRYAWPIFPEYELFISTLDGENVERLTRNWGYDAEATVDWKTDRIVFTSYRQGDLDIYTMNADGSNLQRLTFREGYEGGAFFSRDGSRIVYRAYYPGTQGELEEYRMLLGMNLVSPPFMEIFVMDANGGHQKRLTDLGGVSFAPYFLPDDRGIIFVSNFAKKGSREFHLYTINERGGDLTQITYGDGFESFPYFTPDGKRLIFASTRGAKPGSRELHIYMADWKGPGRVIQTAR
ncbi:MAG: TolB family protein [bacterium JZ-2024 1]